VAETDEFATFNWWPMDDLSHTAQSVLHRAERALAARDKLRWHLTLKQTNDVGDDALEQVDHILIDLVGAFDATARVAHHVLNLGGKRHLAGWQSKAWMREVRRAAPDLKLSWRPGRWQRMFRGHPNFAQQPFSAQASKRWGTATPLGSASPHSSWLFRWS